MNLKRQYGFNLIELIIIIGMLSLCMYITILNPVQLFRKNSEYYASEFISDIHYYHEKAYILYESYELSFQRNGYTVKDRAGSAVKTVILPDDIYIYEHSNLECISLEENKSIINKRGPIIFVDSKSKNVSKITFVPGTGRLHLINSKK